MVFGISTSLFAVNMLWLYITIATLHLQPLANLISVVLNAIEHQDIVNIYSTYRFATKSKVLTWVWYAERLLYLRHGYLVYTRVSTGVSEWKYFKYISMLCCSPTIGTCIFPFTYGCTLGSTGNLVAPNYLDIFC